MKRLAKSALTALVLIPGMVLAQSAQTIYKFVDESGRVTYANSPMKGATKLDLDPITVLQNTPIAANAPAPAARSVPVAKVVSVPSTSFSMVAATMAPAANPTTAAISAPIVATAPSQATVAAIDTNDKLQERAQQRRADIRQRILQSELQATEKSRDAARAALADEQRRSGEIRTLRASFSVTAQAATPQKPLISEETRAEIERHFERIRNLQDEITMHEESMAALREEVIAKK